MCQNLDEICRKPSFVALSMFDEATPHRTQVKKIDMLSFEFGSCNLDSRTYFQDIFYFLKQYQMGDIFRITPSGYLSPIHEYQEVYERFWTTNFIALPTRSH
jgi:hypothetical protein